MTPGQNLRACSSTGAAQTICFVRHGATSANLAGLRCGGDLDLPLTEAGRRQAEQLARLLTGQDLGVIVTSDLQRTRETAAILARALGGLPVVTAPGWAERRLGEWNLRPIAETQAALMARRTPPGGESDAEFVARIARAARALAAWMPRRPLLVGSKGVARALGEITGMPARMELANGALCRFDLSTVLRHQEPVTEST